MKNIKRLLLLFILLLIPFNVFADEININSTNAIMINLNNNKVIYEKNKDDVINVASMQKIMTAIVAIKQVENLDESFTLDYGIFDSLDPELVMVGFDGGDTVTYNDLLYGTLLKSGGDAAYALGIKISGSEEEYAKLMNDKAKELSLNNSNFINTTGLDIDGQYSTVSDIAYLFKYGLNDKNFNKIISTKDYTTSNGYYEFSGPIAKANDLGMPYFKGGKTGFTDSAGRCLASYAEKDGVQYLLVTAGAPDEIDNSNYLDHKTLYEYFMNNYSFKTVVSDGDIIDKINTIYDDEVVLEAKEDVELYLKNDIDIDDLDIYYKGKTELDRSIKEGDKIGKFYVEYDGEILYKTDVLSPMTVKFKLRTPYKIILGLVILLILIKLLSKKKRRRKRRNRY